MDFLATAGDQTHQNPSLKEAIAKAKEAEQALRENPTVKENVTRFKEAEQKFRDHPSVKDNLEKLREVEKNFREEVKDKQVRLVPRTLWALSHHACLLNTVVGGLRSCVFGAMSFPG